MILAIDPGLSGTGLALWKRVEHHQSDGKDSQDKNFISDLPLIIKSVPGVKRRSKRVDQYLSKRKDSLKMNPSSLIDTDQLYRMCSKIMTDLRGMIKEIQKPRKRNYPRGNSSSLVLDKVIIETQQIWGSTAKAQASANSGKLIKLSTLTGMIIYMINCPNTYLIKPNEWKGQLSDHQVKSRLRRLGQSLGWSPKLNEEFESSKQHSIDAFGIGLYYLGYQIKT